MKPLRTTLLCGACLLAGCAGLRPTIPTTAISDGASGYAASFFSSARGPGYALTLLNMDSGEEFTMPLGEPTTLPSAHDQEVTMIAVPPGNYRVAKWLAFTSLTRERLVHHGVPADHILARPFSVAAGAVHVVGSFRAVTESSYRVTNYSIRPGRISEPSASAAIRAKYPGFERAPVSCALCVPDEARSPRAATEPPKLTDLPKLKLDLPKPPR